MYPEKRTAPHRRVTWDPRGLLRIEFEYDHRLVALVKGLPGRQWNNGEKFWTVPSEHITSVVELLRSHGFAFDEESLRLYEAGHGAAGDHLTVSQLNLQVRDAVLKAFPVPLWIVGEVSGFNRNAHRRWVSFQLVERAASGETLAQVETVLSPDDRQNLEAKLQREGAPFRLEDGVQVRVLVAVDLHTSWGRYQVAVRDIDVAYTLGEVARRREQIVRKLTAEGVIERNRSLAFPDLPLRIGLVTSLGSDAAHDVLRTLRESGFSFQVVVHGARVQGPNTEPSVLNALDWFRGHAQEFDVVLICRGGGSRTDLAWFDSEALGRAVALFPVPVVVGIGHEADRCVLDEVGWRLKTPTAAAQFVVDRVSKALDRVESAHDSIIEKALGQISKALRAHGDRAKRLAGATRGRLQDARKWVKRLAFNVRPAVERLLGRTRQRQEDLSHSLSRQARSQVKRAGERLEERAKRLRALDPRRVVERGYAIVRLMEGTVVTDAAQAPPHALLRAQLRRGVLLARSEGEEKGGD